MNWKKFIKVLLKEFRTSTYRLEKEHSLSSATLSGIMTGKTISPNQNTVRDLELALNIRIDDSDPENITYTKNEPERKGIPSNATIVEDNVQFYPYPLIATVSAGPGVFDSALYHEVFYMNFKPNGHRLFAVKVDGNSMDTTIVDGSIVLVDQDAPLTNNCIVAVMLVNGKQFIKRYKELNNEFIKLFPDNKEHESFVVTKTDIVSIYKVVQAVTELN